jgi:hypothetical protein
VSDPLDIIDTARVDVARVRGFLSIGDRSRADGATVRAMAALNYAKKKCPTWALPSLRLVRRELDAAMSRKEDRMEKADDLDN